jgi:hypothetical protein
MDQLEWEVKMSKSRIESIKKIALVKVKKALKKKEATAFAILGN